MMMIMMKSRLPRPFLLPILLLIVCTLSGLESVLVKSEKQFLTPRSWQDAQTFCRTSLHYNDLAIIYNQSEAISWNLERYNAWVGVYKQSTPYYNWQWLNGHPLDSWTWATNEPDWDDSCAYIHYNENQLYGSKCEVQYFFICNIKNHDDKFTFINQSMTWSDAQQYCNQFNGGLAANNDYNHLRSAVQQEDFPVWIGLYRDGETWKWSMGVSNYRNWALNQPGDSGDCVAINSLSKTMTTQSCSAQYPFICSKDNLVLVKENKTWEEAVDYCKDLISQTNSPHQLVSVQPGDYSYMMGRAMEADTDEVWTGLRFLAGNWMWVNGADMSLSDLPLCPLSGQNCGVFSKNDMGSLQTRDCAEKNNFLCYSLW